MLKAVLRQGAIVPLDPLPHDWEDGAILDVAKSAATEIDIDAWAKSMNELCADSSAKDQEVMRCDIEGQRQQVAWFPLADVTVTEGEQRV